MIVKRTYVIKLFLLVLHMQLYRHFFLIQFDKRPGLFMWTFWSLVLNTFPTYTFWNSQSYSVILHRMYFHWRSLQKSKTESNMMWLTSLALHFFQKRCLATVGHEPEHSTLKLDTLTYLSTPLKVVWAPRMK